MDTKREIKNTKICHLTSVHPPYDIRIFYKECISLAKVGHNVTLIAPNANRETREEIDLIPIKLPKSRFKRMLVVSIRMYMLALKTKAMVFHFHDPELMLCGILLRLSGKMVIFDIHENVRLSIVSKDWIPIFARKTLGIFYYIFERFALLFYHKLVLAEESYQKYYPSKKSTVVLNYPLLKTLSVEEKGYTPPFKFVYSGVVHPLRGVWEMMDVIKRLITLGYKVTLDVVGELRPFNLKTELEAFIVKNNLEKQVRIHGKVDYSEVAGYLSKAHLGFSLLKSIPNYRESLPTKIFEYMRHGLPVITNDFQLYKKYVEDIETGICVNIEDIDEMVEKIRNLLMNTDQLKKMSKNGINVTKNQYNWKLEESKLVDLYDNLLAGRKRI